MQTIARAALLLVAALIPAACARETARDARPTPARRVITLMPSFADDAYAVGAGGSLVGVSAFTDAPGTRALARVADASSVDAEAIVALRPDVVIGIPAQARSTEPLRRAGLRVVLLADDSYASIFENLTAIGRLTGHAREAEAQIARMRSETAVLHARTKTYRRHPSLFVVLGSGPIWTAGEASYISTLIALAGGVNAAAGLRAAYGQYSAEALLRRQPDLLVADAAIRLDAALDREPWRDLTAVKLGRVYDVNPDLIERPGPAYNDGVRWLVERLAPIAALPQ
jgi:iron complex transport system substrate-binding protein